MPMSDAVSSEGPKTTGIQQRSSALSLTHRDFSSLFESFDDVMHCIWWDLQSLCNLTLKNVDVEDVPQSFLCTLSQIGEPLPILMLEGRRLISALPLFLHPLRVFIELHPVLRVQLLRLPSALLSRIKKKHLFKPVLPKYCNNNDLMFLPGFNT